MNTPLLLQIQSMTGFSSHKKEEDSYALEIQCRSVNSRYLDIHLRISKEYQPFEIELRQLIQNKISRGKLEITITRRVSNNNDGDTPLIDRKRFENYFKLYKELFIEFGSGASPENLDRVIPEIIKIISAPSSALSDPIIITEQEKISLFQLFELCLEDFIASRFKEGEKLVQDIKNRFDLLTVYYSKIRDIASQASAQGEQREKILKRLESIKGASGIVLDEQRISQEILHILEKMDIHEELIRLESHLVLGEKMFQGQETHSKGIGKKLEFLMQEILRESNTIASKSYSSEMSHLVVDMKVEIEKIKEQLQNIE